MIETNLHGDILEIALAHPPVNALSAPVRRAWMEAVGQAQVNDAGKAILICGGGKAVEYARWNGSTGLTTGAC